MRVRLLWRGKLRESRLVGFFGVRVILNFFSGEEEKGFGDGGGGGRIIF